MKTSSTAFVAAVLFGCVWYYMWPDPQAVSVEHAPVPYEERSFSAPVHLDEILNAIAALQLNARSQLEAATPERLATYMEWYDESAWLALFGTPKPQ